MRQDAHTSQLYTAMVDVPLWGLWQSRPHLLAVQYVGQRRKTEKRMMGDASSRDLSIRFRSLQECDLTGLAWLPRLINGTSSILPSLE